MARYEARGFSLGEKIMTKKTNKIKKKTNLPVLHVLPDPEACKLHRSKGGRNKERSMLDR